MSETWFILEDRGRLGPFSRAELLATVVTYANPDEVLVRSGNAQSWCRFGDCSEFAKGNDAGSGNLAPSVLLASNERHPTPPILKSTGLFAAHRWVKGGAVIGFVVGALNTLAQVSEGKANGNGVYLVALIVVSACIGGIVAFIIGAIADWMSRPKKTLSASSFVRPNKSIANWNFIAAHWSGQLPLWVSYWIINIVASVITGVVVALTAATFEPKSGYDPLLVFYSISIVWLTVAALLVWQIVGLWRSANNHIARRAALGRRAPWAGLAKLAAIGLALQLVGTFSSSAIPQLSEASRIAFMGDPDTPSYQFRIMRNGTEVEITGGFKYGLTDEFSKLLKAARQIRVVHLDSIGGRIGEAKKLYNVIRENKLVTYVSAKCASACTLAFAAGRERYIARNAILGFHAPSFPGMSKDELQSSISEQSKLFIEAGLEPSFVSRALNTPSSDLWKPTIAELFKARVITGVSDGNQFAASGYGNITKESMAASLEQVLPLLKPLKERMPMVYQEIVDVYFDSYVAGETEVTQIAKARSKIIPLLSTLKPIADDDVLVDLAKLAVDSFKWLSTKNATTCYLYASGTDTNRSFASDLGPALVKRELDLDERIIRTARSRPQIPNATVDATWAKFRSLMSIYKIKEEEIELLSSSNLPVSKHLQYCLASINFYSAVAALPMSEGAVVMRSILEQK